MLYTKKQLKMREYKDRGHSLINSLRKNGMTKKEVYKWLAYKMNQTEEQTHFAIMNEEQCDRAIRILKKEAERLRTKKRHIKNIEKKKQNGHDEKIGKYRLKAIEKVKEVLYKTSKSKKYIFELLADRMFLKSNEDDLFRHATRCKQAIEIMDEEFLKTESE